MGWRLTLLHSHHLLLGIFMVKQKDQAEVRVDSDIIRKTLLCIDEEQNKDPEMITNINSLIALMEQTQRDRDGEESDEI